MSETKFTPGPWRRSKGSFLCQININTDSGTLATVYGDTGENEANAHLIAAAPDLYEALELMIEWDDREEDHAVDFYQRMDMCREAFAKARAALAKARGENQ